MRWCCYCCTLWLGGGCSRSPQQRRGCHAAARVVTAASTRPRARATSWTELGAERRRGQLGVVDEELAVQGLGAWRSRRRGVHGLLGRGRCRCPAARRRDEEEDGGVAVSVVEVRASSSLALGGAAARAPGDRGELGAAAAGARRGEGVAVTAWPRLGEVLGRRRGSGVSASGQGLRGAEARARSGTRTRRAPARGRGRGSTAAR